MRYSLLVTGPAYGTQQSASALLFAQALLAAGHQLSSVFFYGEGVHNANAFTSPASDEADIVRAWQKLQQEQGVALQVCIAAAMRRGVSQAQQDSADNLQPGFELSGLGALAEAALSCDRLVQF